MKRGAALFWIRLVHTLIWAVFAGAILAIPVATASGNLGLALGLSLLVVVEVVILVVNGMRCPLNAVAGRFTEARPDGFDIFLPPWLARHNKLIFGTLFVVAELYLLWRWLTDF